MIKYLKQVIEKNDRLRELKYLTIRPLHKLTVSLSALETAQKDIKSVLSCPEYEQIPKNQDAGKIKNGKLVMHNGIMIFPGSYYGYGNLKFLQATGGVHEPQEEYVFSKVLNVMPSGATMLELGAYWSFYSLWFHKVVHNPKCYLIEPTLSNLNYGKKNFALNGFVGDFTQAFISKSNSVNNSVRQVCVDKFLEEKEIPHLNILHADIQGYELDMLDGATKHIGSRKIDYMFISTHSNQLHAECIDFLQKYNYTLIASANLNESFSSDGVIVAQRAELNDLQPLRISRRS